jgi:hypothetical protein
MEDAPVMMLHLTDAQANLIGFALRALIRSHSVEISKLSNAEEIKALAHEIAEADVLLREIYE